MRLFTVRKSSLQRLSDRTPDTQQKTSYEELRREERKKFSRKRTRFHYESNYTCALALPYSKTHLNSQWDDESTLLSMCEAQIIEHTSRRVDLFFYTLIAYYQSAILPVEGRTTVQHGIGRNIEYKHYGTQACHSSFTPALLDQTIFQDKTDDITYKSILSGTHFLESLNATVELPPFMNVFDDILESICRPICIKIIHNVSLGKINPIEGLADFLTIMNTILQDFKQQASRENYTSLTYPNLHDHRYVSPKLIDLVIQGTLENSYNNRSNTVNDLYIQSLLRIAPEETMRCKKTLKNREKLYLETISAIQNEILNTESEVMHYSI